MNPRRVRLIAAYGTRYALRGGTGVVFAILTLFTGLLVARAVVSPAEVIARQASEAGADAGPVQQEALAQHVAEVSRTPVAWLLGAARDDAWLSHLVDQRPALMSAAVLVLMMLLPLLVAVGSFNQFAGEIGDRSIRYQLLRAGRADIYFGRFLGAYIFAAGLIVLLAAAVTVYLGANLDIYSWSRLVRGGIGDALALCILSLPYVALCAWISASSNSAFMSLTACVTAIGLVPLLSFVGGAYWAPLSIVGFLLPWGAQRYLLHPNPWSVAAAAGACLAYTVAFLALGYRSLSRRDL